jgi:hypothetical protein
VPFVPIVLIGIAGALFLVPAVAATLVLTNTSFAPPPPLVPGPLEVSATMVIIPTGSTTFPRGHEIQMQTGLADAQWDIQVMADGIPAARQTAKGTAAFVNGVLISYPTTYDVSLVVTLKGGVPATAGPEVILLQAEEIDNSGNVVPGSLMTVSRPVPGSTETAPAISAVNVTTVTAMPLSVPTKMPGFSALAGIGAMVTGWIIAGNHFYKKDLPNMKVRERF